MIKTSMRINENLTMYIDEMLLAGSDLLNQALSKGGAKFNEIARRNLRQQANTGWSVQKNSIRKTIITGHGIEKNFGDRLKKTGAKDDPKNMESMIKNYLDEKNHLIVVMGRHGSFQPIKFRNGKRVGTYGKRIGGTAKGGADNPEDIINILQKLNDGGVKTLTMKQQWLLSSVKMLRKNKKGEIEEYQPFIKSDYGGKLIPMIKKVTYRRTNFATNARFQGTSVAMGIIKSEYDKYFDSVMKEIGKVA